ncbi:MAG: energy-coupling factor transporter transmembrane component T [Chloroflexota bacterium]|nr:energy-coupling factor transporter transmembrane component T [Chloroflexota bacterium]
MSSRFEFLGNTDIAQYIPRASWFHHRDPRARLLSFTAIFFSVVFAPDISGLGIGFICVILIYCFASLPIKSTLKMIRRALPFIILLAIIQILFSKPSDIAITYWSILGFKITHHAVMDALILVCRFLVLISLINALVMSISTSQVTAALFHLLKPFEVIGFPVNDFTMVVQITLRYLPLVAQLAEKTAKAQAARGGDWEQKGFNPIRQAKRVLPLIVPLMVSSLRRAETMALAMESRGFNASEHRSSFYILNFSWWDVLLLIMAIAMAKLTFFISKIF